MTILYILIAVVVLFVIVVSMRPAAFSVSRSATISAPPQAVFPHVNDLHKWQVWSPWAKLDPNSAITYSGPVAGTGASFAWSGSMKVGAGRMTITESRPNELVIFKLEFLKPITATNIAEFTFAPDGSQTIVKWTMSGKNNFVGKLFSIFFCTEKMVGPQFEKGLADMKSLAEASANS